jgi:hypothetical protein
LANAEKDGEAYAASVGAKSLAELRALPASALLKGKAGEISHPVLEPYVMPQSPYDVRRGATERRADPRRLECQRGALADRPISIR